jgi:hypothetical protein
MNKDLQHLKILSIFHYVIGGLIAFMSCFALFYLFLGVLFVAAPPPSMGDSPPPAVGWIFIILSISVMLLGWAWAIALIVAGWFLGCCRHYLYCMVMGCSVLLFQPLGTILGIFTIIVLVRPNVKRLFETGGQLEDEDEIEEIDHPFRRDSYNNRR